MNVKALSELKIKVRDSAALKEDLLKSLSKKSIPASSQNTTYTNQAFDIRLNKLNDELRTAKQLILLAVLLAIPVFIFSIFLSWYLDTGARIASKKAKDDLLRTLKIQSELTLELREYEKINAESIALLKELKTELNAIQGFIYHCRDCHDYFILGFTSPDVYTIFLNNMSSREVWCDFDTSRGWTVIQRRVDGSLDFNRKWSDYRNGFGEVKGEYWLGNELIHMLTRQNKRLNISIQFTGGRHASGTWSNFTIEDESAGYQLNLGNGTYNGTLEKESFEYHNKQKFSTFDHDNDGSRGNCAAGGQGGWWYNHCTLALLNGVYGRASPLDGTGWIGQYIETTMKVTRN